MKNGVVVLLVAAIGAVPAGAQVTVGGMGGTPTTGSGGQTNVQAIPSLAGGGGSRVTDVARPIYISGKVMMQDGSPLPQNVTIERICSGLSRTVAYTDSHGQFGFQWGERNMIVADASDAGSPSNRNSPTGFGSSQSAGGASALATDPFGNRMMNCQLRASLAGFTSDMVSLLNRRSADSPDVGVIVLHRIAGVQGASISVTGLMAPRDAKKAYERGLQSMLKNKPDDAAKDFEKAVAAYPKYADAWMRLGKLRLEQQSIEPARTALLKAVESDPKLVMPYVELGLLSSAQAHWRESCEYLDKALQLDPVDYPQAWYADAVAWYNLKNYEVAEKSAREAVKRDANHVNPRSDYLLGLVLMEKQDYAGAITELTTFIRFAPNAPDLPQAREQLAQLEKISGTAKQASGTQP